MNSQPPHARHSIRLKGYDYRQAGAYFVTLVTAGRGCVFGKVQDGKMNLSQIGEMVAAIWQALPAHFPVVVGDWVVMPNHLHGIIVLTGEAANLPDGVEEAIQAGTPSRRPNGTAPGSLGAILQNFKSNTTRRANILGATPGAPLWQRNYYEHILRSPGEWERIRLYILANPLQWAEDRENPESDAPRG